MPYKSIAASCLGLLLLMTSRVACAASHQDQAQQPFFTSAEYTAFQSADQEENPQAKIKLLNDFVAKYRDSTLMPEVYRDYYLTHLLMKNYRQTVEYADKFLALGDSTDLGYRLEALMTRAQAFVEDCGEAVFQTPDAYNKATAAAVQGLQTVNQFPISPDCDALKHPCLAERERLETLFYSVVGIAQSEMKGDKVDSCIPRNIEINSIRLFGWQNANNKKSYVELNEFRETASLHLVPSPKFDVVCEVSAKPDLSTGDFLLWISVDFLVAPVTQKYEEMESDQIDSHVIWDRSPEMHDFKAMPIYFLRPKETRRVVIKEFDLTNVLAAFPVGDADNTWPWFVRVNIHVQDRSGRQIASAERIVRLSPDSARKKVQPLPLSIGIQK